jgi:predicted transcriptional regulator
VFLAKRDDLLALDTRRSVHEWVSKYPGLHLREIARGTDLDPNHVKYHLSVLEKHGLVSSRKEDGYWRFWPKVEGSLGHQDALPPDEKKVLALLRREIPLHVTLRLLEDGEANQRRLVDHLGVSQSTLSYHLKRMEKDGLVVVEKEGRERIYRLVDHERIHALLLRYRPPDALVQGFLDAWEQLEL